MNVLLGITGGIAAYKAPDLIRRLRERDINVQVVMTRSAHRFVTATTLQAVSGAAIRDDLWDEQAEAAMGHIELARWADRVLIAPATADFLSRLAQAAADDLLTTLCLATEAPIAVAPAMNHVMWANTAVQENVATIARRGVRVMGPAVGAQACGETGAGRMMEPADIVDALLDPAASAAGPLVGKTVLVTAGPTREAIDPVRYISNHSSGKMGYAMAAAARDAGARVILLSGPVNLSAPVGVQRVMIQTADELLAAATDHAGECDIFIAAAAVADYRPAHEADEKIKKTGASMSINLVRSPDILSVVASRPTPPFTVGFAAETNKLKEHALGKLAAKKLDMIIANKVGGGLAFGRDENAAQVFWEGGERTYPMASKRALASDLLALIAQRFSLASSDTPVAGAKVANLAQQSRRD